MLQINRISIFNKNFWTSKRILLSIFGVLLFIDILTKQLIIYLGYGDFFKLYFESNFKIVGIIFGRVTSFFNLVLVHNKGISFSMLSNNNPMMRWALSIVAILIVVFILQLIKEERKLNSKIALTFIISGAIGNIIDRLRFGSVIDFLDFHIIGYHWPAFNFADTCISLGVFLFIMIKIIENKKHISKK